MWRGCIDILVTIYSGDEDTEGAPAASSASANTSQTPNPAAPVASAMSQKAVDPRLANAPPQPSSTSSINVHETADQFTQQQMPQLNQQPYQDNAYNPQQSQASYQQQGQGQNIRPQSYQQQQEAYQSKEDGYVNQNMRYTRMNCSTLAMIPS